MSAASLLQKVAKTAATAKVAGFNKAIKKVSSVKNRLEVTAHQVKAVQGFKGFKSDESESGSDSYSGDSNQSIDDNSNDDEAEGQGPEAEDETEAEKERKRLSPSNIRRMRAQLKTVEDILLSGENLEIGSDSDISDASQIWSEYGDEITIDKEPKLVRWHPTQKKIGQRVNMTEKPLQQLMNPQAGNKKTIEIKRIRNNAFNKMGSEKAQGLFASLAAGVSGPGHGEASVDEVDGDEPKGRRTPPHEAGFSFVPIGAGTTAGKGVYYLDFSNEFRKCLKMAREDLEKSKGMNHLQKAETNWIRTMKADKSRTLEQKLLCLKLETMRQTGRFSSPKRTKSKGSPISSQKSSRKTSPSRSPNPENQAESLDPKVPKKEDSRPSSTRPGGAGPTTGGGSGQPPKKADQSHDAMGTKWPKGMWDNTENYWRMIMAEDQFVITPANYNRQLDVEFRQKTVSVDYSQLTDARTKCLEWIAANREFFSL